MKASSRSTTRPSQLWKQGMQVSAMSRTWRQHLAVLRDLGFIDCKEGLQGNTNTSCSTTPIR